MKNANINDSSTVFVPNAVQQMTKAKQKGKQIKAAAIEFFIIAKKDLIIVPPLR